MTTRCFVAIVALLTVFALCGTAFEADAARFGGGRSFGGSSSFSKPFSSSRLPESTVRTPSGAQQQQPGAVAGAAARPGFGGMGGIFGGLLAGTLLGSLLSGNGFAGGGMLDILLIAGALYLVFKFLGRRRTVQHGQTNASMGMPVPDDDGRNQTLRDNVSDSRGNGMWDMLRNRGESAAGPAAQSAVNVPAGFDQEEFLRGARMLYQRMNDSWDRRDLNDIAEFATQPFLTEIREQAEASPNPERTEIMLVTANLVGVVREAGRETASVYFDVMLREDPSQREAIQVREVWHFVRAADSKDMWKLDGIQQVE